MKIAVGMLCAIALWGEDRQTIDRSFTLPAGPRTVEIRGISGFIRVTGAAGNGVTFHVEQRLDARTPEGLIRLKDEVKLRFTETGGVVKAEVEKRDRDWEKGQKVEHDFTVTVPQDVRLVVRNVNGEISVDDVRGEYELKTVNGKVVLNKAAGAGTVETVNGALQATYVDNPRNNVTFKTINGKIELWLRPGLDADFNLKTMNGKIYSDFEMSSRPSSAEASGEKRGTKWVYRSDGKAATRVGKGGPLFALSGLNSEILIHSSGK